ncbi:MAG: hypothetical protein Q4D19_07410 [Lautropia sp.]|nr:hypothetical protein [Lautropia sp.]
MTVAALSVLLAACGSDGDDNSAVSASPAANTTASTSATASATAAATAGNESAGTTAPDTPTPGTPVALISDKGIRGDVLLALLDEKECRSADAPFAMLGAADANGNHLQGAPTPFVFAGATLSHNAYFYDEEYWKRPGVTIPVDGTLANCAATRYQNPVQPGDYQMEMGSRARYQVFRSVLWGDPGITKGFNASVASFPVKVQADRVEIASTVVMKQEEDIGYTMQRRARPEPGTYRTAENSLSAAQAYSFARQGLVPFGRLQEWKDAVGNTVQLLLNKGSAADEFAFCLNTSSAMAKRLDCKTWKVPANWTWGQEPEAVGYSVQDDRSVYATGESGFLYWQVRP